MLPNKHRYRTLCLSLNPIFIPPANTDGEFSIAMTIYTEIVGSKEVI